MNSFSYDPYAILQIDRNSDIREVKAAFKALAKVYHPDKGGHPEMFRMLKEAYNTILRFIEGQSSREIGHMGDRNPKEHLAELMKEQKVMQRGNLDHRNFSRDRFNAEFESQRNINNDYVYDVDLHMANRMGQKTFDQLQRERSSMNAEIGNIKPLFNRGRGFDPNVFNRIFDKYKKDKGGGGAGDAGAMVPYQEPIALTSHGNMEFSHALQPHGGGGGGGAGAERGVIGGGGGMMGGGMMGAPIGGDYQDQMFQHPGEVDSNMMNDFRELPDITQVSSMARDEIKNRMNEYRSQKFNSGSGRGEITGYLGMGDQGMGNQGMGNRGMGNRGVGNREMDRTKMIEYRQPPPVGNKNEIENLKKQLNEMQLKVQKMDEMERKVKIQDRLIKKIHQDRQSQSQGQGQSRGRRR